MELAVSSSLKAQRGPQMPAHGSLWGMRIQPAIGLSKVPWQVVYRRAYADARALRAHLQRTSE